MEIVRIIFENGVDFYRSDDGKWFLQSVIVAKFGDMFNEITKIYELRPVLVEKKFPNGRVISGLLKTNIPSQLFTDTQKLIKTLDKDLISRYRINNLEYICGALLYHCKKLAYAYADTCNSFDKTHKPEENETQSTLGSQEEILFEFDSFISAAKRIFETLRFIIWDKFMCGSTSIPKDFFSTFNRCKKKMPEKLSESVDQSLTQFGENLRWYRNCSQHHLPLNKGISFSHMKKLGNLAWATSIFLPDNPEACSQVEFTFSKKIDALTYSWELTNKILELVQTIINEIS